MGGEKKSSRCCTSIGLGSPPRRRGKDQPLINDAKSWGITPAWAGKRPAVWSSKSKNGDHPRVGGEKFERWLNYGYGRGSPPRGRGKVEEYEDCIINPRITPAWAGKSSWRLPFSSIFEDHPRVGGEKSQVFDLNQCHRGSPPRGRGKGCLFRPCPRRIGITPAWAGKRLQHTVGNPAGQDHPRVGGEKKKGGSPEKSGLGSPPRGRGKA